MYCTYLHGTCRMGTEHADSPVPAETLGKVTEVEDRGAADFVQLTD